MTRRGLRLLAEYARMHPVVMGVAVFGAAVYAATTVASSVVLGHITDSVLVPGFGHGVSRRTVAGGVVAVLGVALLRCGGIVVRRFFAGLTHARVARDLRRRVTDRYAQLPLAYHRAQPTGDLLAHVQADVEAATDIIGPFPYSTAVVLMIVFAAVTLVLTDWVLAIVGCTVLPGLAVMNQVFMHFVEPPAARAQRGIGEVSAVAHESIDGALVVKTLGREAEEVTRFAARAERLRDERIHMGRVRASFEPGLDALPDLAVVALVALGAWRVNSGAITTGTLVQFLSLFQLLAYPMRLIGFLLAGFPRAVVGRDRLEEVFSAPVRLHSTGSAPLPAAAPDRGLQVRVEGVDFSYTPGTPVLAGVGFSVAPGEAVALVGRTGSGKSTLAQLLVRLGDPDAGRILLGGVDVRSLDPAAMRGAVAMVFQESFLFGTSIEENVTLGEPISREAVIEAARIAQADGFVRALPAGYATPVGERGVTLSGGQRQRIALARALVRRPRLLILDDATSAVDPTVEARILEGLRRQRGLTLVLIAYRTSAISLADRVLLLEAGRISATGTHAQLLHTPAYAAMVRAYESGGPDSAAEPDAELVPAAPGSGAA